METTNNNTATTASEFKMPSRFEIFEDAERGWLKVPFAALVVLNIQDKISTLSRRQEDMAYLIDGPDSSVFLAAYIEYVYEKVGTLSLMLINIYHGKRSPIHDLPDYNY